MSQMQIDSIEKKRSHHPCVLVDGGGSSDGKMVMAESH